MEFRSVRYGLAVARERSFTRAAARLNVSQSAVSEQVKLLEGHLGFELFRRTGRGIEVTERGRAFLAEAERVARDWLGLQEVARRLSGVGIDTLSLGLGSGLASYLLPRMLPSGRLPPQVRLEVRTAPTRVIFDDLDEGRIDLGFAASVAPDRVPAGLVPAPIAEVELKLILPPGHPLAAPGGPVDLAEAAGEPFIMSELAVGYGQVVMDLFSDMGVQPAIRAVVDNVETIKVMVAAKVGVAVVPSWATDGSREPAPVEVRSLAPARSVSISSYRSRHGLPRRKDAVVAALLDPLQAALGPAERL